MSDAVPHIQRVWLTLKADADGRATLAASLMPPASIDATMLVLVARGLLPMGEDETLPLVSDPSADPTLRGPAGANATDAQVAAAAAAYLAANPPAAGKDGTNGLNASDTQVATAVAVWMTAHPLSTVLGTVTLGETAAVAIQAGVRRLTVACPGVKAGDAIVLAPTAALPAGFMLGQAIATADGKLQIALTVPLIAVNGKYSIAARVLRLG